MAVQTNKPTKRVILSDLYASGVVRARRESFSNEGYHSSKHDDVISGEESDSCGIEQRGQCCIELDMENFSRLSQIFNFLVTKTDQSRIVDEEKESVE